MKQMALILSLVVLSASAFASAQYKKTYTCFNKAQMLDAPILSIESNTSGKQFIHQETRGDNSYLPLTPVDKAGLLDNRSFEAPGYSVLEIAGIENPPKRASITLNSTGRVYICTPVLQAF